MMCQQQDLNSFFITKKIAPPSKSPYYHYSTRDTISHNMNQLSNMNDLPVKISSLDMKSCITNAFNNRPENKQYHLQRISNKYGTNNLTKDETFRPKLTVLKRVRYGHLESLNKVMPNEQIQGPIVYHNAHHTNLNNTKDSKMNKTPLWFNSLMEPCGYDCDSSSTTETVARMRVLYPHPRISNTHYSSFNTKEDDLIF